jgi:RimJ/RimL family protein N-acetyltransferase
MRISLSPLASLLQRVTRRARDAGQINIRAIEPDDRERLLQAFRALDQKAIYQRFFFPKRDLSDRELRFLTESKDARSVVLVATTGLGAREEIVGLGQYARSGATAEVAFAVRAEYRCRGIAARLLRRLVRIGRDEGVASFEAEVLAENRPMLTVFRHSGLPMTETQEGPVIHITLALDGAGRLAQPS